MKRALAAIALLASASIPPAAAGAAQYAQATDDADARFEALYTDEWNWRSAEGLGGDEEAVPAALPDVSPQAHARRLQYWDNVLAQLRALDRTALSRRNRVNYDVYIDQIADLAASERFREYEIPLNSAGGFWSGAEAAAGAPYRTEAEYRQYLALLDEIPRYFAQQVANMRTGMQRGFMPARIVLEGRDLSIAVMAEATGPEETAYYAPFKAMPAALPKAGRNALQREAAKVIAEEVIPAYRDLLAFFRSEYLPASRSSIAAIDLPGGTAYYDWKVRQATTLDQTPDQVHRIGLEEVAGIRADMEKIIAEVGFKGDLKAFLTFLRTDPRFYARTPEDYLKQAAWTAKRFDGMAADYFGHFPRTRFGIRPFPPEIAPFATGAAGGRTTYWLNTYKLDSRPLYSLPALTLHESAPGHSWQMSIAAENEDQPPFRREVYISAFGEGWALYCEKLGIEMGLYDTPYDTFGMLSYRMWRAARLVVDTGIHAKGWSRQQAIRYLADNTAIGEHEIETEIDRYISNPGQALSYYTGTLAIERLRAKAEDALGEKFDIRHFHDTVLALGSVPLPVLEREIDRFIASGGAASE